MPKNPEQLSLEYMSSADRILHLTYFPTPQRSKNRIPRIYLERNIINIPLNELYFLSRLCMTKEGLDNLKTLIKHLPYTNHELETFKASLESRLNRETTEHSYLS